MDAKEVIIDKVFFCLTFDQDFSYSAQLYLLFLRQICKFMNFYLLFIVLRITFYEKVTSDKAHLLSNTTRKMKYSKIKQMNIYLMKKCVQTKPLEHLFTYSASCICWGICA